MNRWRWAGLMLVALLGVGPLFVWAHRHATGHRIPLKPRAATAEVMRHINDPATPWSSSWVVDGIPKRWRSSHDVPSMVVDPAHLHRIWWFWPPVQNGRVWFATSQGSLVTWQQLSLRDMAHAAILPMPLQVTAQWVMTLETGQGAIPTMQMEPAGAFLAYMGSVTGVTGWEAGMEPTPGTIVVTWGLRQRVSTGLRFVTLWHWQFSQGWQCVLGIFQKEPQTSLVVPPMASERVPLLPGWTSNSPH